MSTAHLQREPPAAGADAADGADDGLVPVIVDVRRPAQLTPEQLYERHQAHLAQRVRRDGRHRRQAWVHRRRVVLGAAGIGLVGLLFLMPAFPVRWWAWPLTLGIGVTAGASALFLQLRTLGGMLAFAAIGLLGLALHHQTGAVELSFTNNRAQAMGGAMMLFMTMILWVVAGGVAGFVNGAWDDDHTQL